MAFMTDLAFLMPPSLQALTTSLSSLVAMVHLSSAARLVALYSVTVNSPASSEPQKNRSMFPPRVELRGEEQEFFAQTPGVDNPSPGWDADESCIVHRFSQYLQR